MKVTSPRISCEDLNALQGWAARLRNIQVNISGFLSGFLCSCSHHYMNLSHDASINYHIIISTISIIQGHFIMREGPLAKPIGAAYLPLDEANKAVKTHANHEYGRVLMRPDRDVAEESMHNKDKIGLYTGECWMRQSRRNHFRVVVVKMKVGDPPPRFKTAVAPAAPSGLKRKSREEGEDGEWEGRKKVAKAVKDKARRAARLSLLIEWGWRGCIPALRQEYQSASHLRWMSFRLACEHSMNVCR